jgi:hypothetical protein
MKPQQLPAEPAQGIAPEPHTALSAAAFACLRQLASRYIWWKPPDEAMHYPKRVAAQVMNLGAWGDVESMVDALGEDYLRDVLRCAEAGQMDARSWHYWHYRLGLAEFGVMPVPPLPFRKIG